VKIFHEGGLKAALIGSLAGLVRDNYRGNESRPIVRNKKGTRSEELKSRTQLQAQLPMEFL
jgi:hypothetical protein